MIVQEQKTRATADEAEAQSREELAVRVQENTAAIETERQARADADNAEASARETLTAKVNENESAIREERTARVNDKKVFTQLLETLTTTVDENTASIETERTARIEADNAEVKAREALSATVDGQSASIQDIQQIIADDEGIHSEDIRTVTAGLEALTQAEIEGLVATAEFQENNRRNLALARETLEAQIADESEARASRELELLAQIDGNKALIHEEQAARADEVESVASDIRTLTTKVDGHGASIETLNEVKNGVTARNYVKLDSNGYVSGFEQYNGGAGTSSFTIAADKFKVVAPGNTDATDVFEYDTETQKLKVKNLEVDGADIKSGTIGGVKIADGAVVRDKIANGAVSSTVSYSDTYKKDYTINGKYLRMGYVLVHTSNSPVIINTDITLSTAVDKVKDLPALLMLMRARKLDDMPQEATATEFSIDCIPIQTTTIILSYRIGICSVVSVNNFLDITHNEDITYYYGIYCLVLDPEAGILLNNSDTLEGYLRMKALSIYK